MENNTGKISGTRKSTFQNVGP